MSIILEGIDLPEKENRMYMMELYADGHCSVAKIEDGKCYELTIPSETEAIQIPKGHGRIGDLDELQKAIRTDIMGGLNYEYFIRNAPTILEPEDECKRCKHKGDEYWCRDAYRDDEGKCNIYEPYGGMRCY